MNKRKRRVLIYENSFTLTNHLVKKWVQLAVQSIEENGWFMVALSGGRTPTEFYSKLSGIAEFEIWRKTHIFLVDERFVPIDDKESNMRMIRENLLDFIDIPEGNVHPILTFQENAAIAAQQYKEALLHYFEFQREKLPIFDFILLGIGDDGHTGSLFPGEPGINEKDIITVPVTLDYLKDDRVSITLPIINNARHVYFLALGAGKSEIIKRLIDEDDRNVPAGLVEPTDGEITFLLDKESAQKLAHRDNYSLQDEAISINDN